MVTSCTFFSFSFAGVLALLPLGPIPNRGLRIASLKWLGLCPFRCWGQTIMVNCLVPSSHILAVSSGGCGKISQDSESS
ncbi:hypothetical protein BGX38DRAFT_1153033 [Terfezia claveryi]|nr:hypothetical protein BGX38DRAFT_1153033 [Terfezia claveryi]